MNTNLLSRLITRNLLKVFAVLLLTTFVSCAEEVCPTFVEYNPGVTVDYSSCKTPEVHKLPSPYTVKYKKKIQKSIKRSNRSIVIAGNR